MKTSGHYGAPPPRPRADSKIKILFLAANPSGMVQLHLDKEVREITQKIRSSALRDRIEIVQAHAVRPEDLRQELLVHQPHIVHFSGHGSADEKIILEDSHGAPFPLPVQALTDLFRILKDNVQVVVLNACFSRPRPKRSQPLFLAPSA